MLLASTWMLHEVPHSLNLFSQTTVSAPSTLTQLVCEETRRLTLARTGKLFERITKYNPYFNAQNSADGKAYDAHFDLLPIPLSAIQANKDAKLEQNPGY